MQVEEQALSNLHSAIVAIGKQAFSPDWKWVHLSHEGNLSDFVKLYRRQVPSLSHFPYSLIPLQINRYFVVLSVGIHVIINGFIPSAYTRLGKVPFYVFLAAPVFSLFKRYFNYGVLFPPCFLIFTQFPGNILLRGGVCSEEDFSWSRTLTWETGAYLVGLVEVVRSAGGFNN
jgi:hypothetical protein